MAGLGPGAVLISPYLLGTEGPEARVSGRVAYILLTGLHLAAAIDKHRAAGIGFDDEFEQVLAALDFVASEFHRNRNGRLDGTAGSDERERVAIVGAEMTAAEAASVLGISTRRVTRIAAGELAGRKVRGRWHVSRAVVEERRRSAERATTATKVTRRT